MSNSEQTKTFTRNNSDFLSLKTRSLVQECLRKSVYYQTVPIRLHQTVPTLNEMNRWFALSAHQILMHPESGTIDFDLNLNIRVWTRYRGVEKVLALGNIISRGFFLNTYSDHILVFIFFSKIIVNNSLFKKMH